jgi:ferredoxin--NADP+ reductase
VNTELQATEKASVQTVTAIKWWTGGLLTFRTTKPENYSYVAGQYARLGLNDSRGTVWRAYSMTSAPHQNELEFYGVLVPGGLFTTQLGALREGDDILVEKQSYGFMTPDRFADGENLWMLATGTGIGPYISMLHDPYVWQHFRKLIVVHGVRHADEFAYSELLETLRKHAPFSSTAELRLVRALTREPKNVVSSDCLRGRITGLLESGALEVAVGVQLEATQSRVMMCGNPEMIEDMRRLLHQREMRPCRRALPGQFVTENYW